MILDYTEDKNLAGIKLLAVDMDLTLLADDCSQPENMPGRIAALAEAGVVFCPASGRPETALEDLFPESLDLIAICADNGANVKYHAEQLFVSKMDDALWREVVAVAAEQGNCAPVLNCFDHAVCLWKDRENHPELHKYYRNIIWVDSYDEVSEDANKISLLFPAWDAEPAFASLYGPQFERKLFVTNAGRQWIDFMNLGVSKGSGIAHLCRELGIDLADAAAVGDTYNDIPMLSAVGHSFVVANAEEHMHQHATYQVPSNNDRGVAVLIDAILAAKGR